MTGGFCMLRNIMKIWNHAKSTNIQIPHRQNILCCLLPRFNSARSLKASDLVTWSHFWQVSSRIPDSSPNLVDWKYLKMCHRCRHWYYCSTKQLESHLSCIRLHGHETHVDRYNPNVSKYLLLQYALTMCHKKWTCEMCWYVLCLVCMSSAPGCGVALFFPIRLLITDGVVWSSAPFWWHAHSVPTFNCPEHSNTKSRLWWTEATSSYQFSAKGRVRRISRIMRNSEADTVFSSNSWSGLKLLLRAMAWFMMRAMGLHIKNKISTSFWQIQTISYSRMN